MNIVLIGYRCSGKTAVGGALAKGLGRRFVDTDMEIEEYARSSIDQLVARYGWDYFREIEEKVIKRACEKERLVIATGGGAIIRKANRTSLKRNGWVVWLKGNTEVLKGRMKKEASMGKLRPSLTGLDALGEIERVMESRQRFYEGMADLIVDTTERDVPQVVSIIEDTLGDTE
jgi:shikimate kinase